MGQVSFKLDGDAAKAVNAFLKVVDAQKKAETGARSAAAASREHESSIQRIGKSAARELGSMAAGWASVAGVMRIASGALGAIREDMARLDAQSKSTTDSIMRAIAGGGDLGAAPRIRYALATRLSGTSVGPAEAGHLYRGIREAAPMASIDRILALTEAGAGAKRAGYYFGQEPQEFGTIVGELAAAAPGRDAGAIANMAGLVSAVQGRHGKKIQRGGFRALGQFMATDLGARPGALQQGLGFLLAGVEAEQGAEPFLTLVQRLAEQRSFAPLAAGQKVSAQESAQRRFYGAGTAAERLAMIQSDPALRAAVFGTQLAGVQAMLRADPAKMTYALNRSVSTNYVLSARTAAGKDQDFRAEQVTQEEEAAAERAEYLRGSGMGGRVLRTVDARSRAKGESAARRWVRTGALWAGRVFAGDMDSSMPTLVPGVDSNLDMTRGYRAETEANLRDASRELVGASAALRRTADRLPNPDAQSE